MNAALFTNSGPQSNDALLRLCAFTPNLAREAPAAAASLTLFAPDPTAFVPEPPGPFRAVQLLPAPGDQEEMRAAVRDHDLLLFDYDATAGNHRQRSAFLRLALGLLRSAGDVPVAVLASQSNFIPDTVELSMLASRNRSRFQQLVQGATHCFAFSSAVAARVGEKRNGREVPVVPGGSPIPGPVHSRVEARALLGFSEPRRDVIIGLLGRQAELNVDWFTAACSEAIRIAQAARVLYLGPDGPFIREHRFSIPLLDAGTPSPEETSVRLRAMDFALLPATTRADARPDRLSLLACLQHGVPVIATSPSTGVDPLFEECPPGLVMVSNSNSNLGNFLEAVESFCQNLDGDPALRPADGALAHYYQTRLSTQAALEKIFATPPPTST